MTGDKLKILLLAGKKMDAHKLQEYLIGQGCDVTVIHSISDWNRFYGSMEPEEKPFDIVLMDNKTRSDVNPGYWLANLIQIVESAVCVRKRAMKCVFADEVDRVLEHYTAQSKSHIIEPTDNMNDIWKQIQDLYSKFNAYQ